MAESNGLRPPPTSTRRQSGCIVTSCPVCIQTSGDLYRFVSVQSSKKFFEPHGVVISGTFDVLNSDGRKDDPGASALQGREPIFSEFPDLTRNAQLRATTSHSLHGPVAAIRINRFRAIEQLIQQLIEQLIQHDSTIWVCLKTGYIPNYSHLIGIMIINHWVPWGTLFSDTPI